MSARSTPCWHRHPVGARLLSGLEDDTHASLGQLMLSAEELRKKRLER
jgi:hypothetical protein